MRIAPEWECWPFWVRLSGEPIPDNCSAERLVAEFGAPAELVAAIDAWDDEYQAQYDRSDPERSGFPDERTFTAWVERGERLAEQLATALPVPVEFRTARGERAFGD